VAVTLGDGDGVGAAVVRVGSGLGLVPAVGDEPPGEISHHSRKSTTSTPSSTTIRRRQYTLAGSGPTGFSKELMVKP
jgi:hypothetical protein